MLEVADEFSDFLAVTGGSILFSTLANKPAIPFGNSNVTNTNNPPNANNHASGMIAVKRVFA